MMTLADLDTPAGVERFARACAAASACMPSLRFFASNKDKPLREVLLTMQQADPEGPIWPMWAWQNVEGEPEFKLHLLKLAMENEGNDVNFAAFIESNEPTTAIEREFLTSLRGRD